MTPEEIATHGRLLAGKITGVIRDFERDTGAHVEAVKLTEPWQVSIGGIVAHTRPRERVSVTISLPGGGLQSELLP